MRLTFSALLLAAASLVSGQTPAGFSPQVLQNLGVAYGTSAVSQAGQRLPQPDLANAPTITFSQQASATRGVLFMIDLDVARNGTRVNLLHWLATDITLTNGSLTIPSTPGAPYLRPNPPAGDSPHRYVFLLYAQPDGFSIPSQYANINPPVNSTARIGFNLTAFAADTSLNSPLAANYITVQSTNSTPATPTTFPPAGGSTVTPSVNGSAATSSLGPSSSGIIVTASPNDGKRDMAPLGLSLLAGLVAMMV